MVSPPSLAVLRAFRAEGEPVAMAGGEGMAFRVGTVVLKRVHDVPEAEWIQATLAATHEDGFRLARPIPTVTGHWVHERWSASEFVPRLRPAAPRWDEIIECGLRFGAAAERARPRSADALATRKHRWAIADRVAWCEADVALSPAAREVHQQLAELMSPDRSSERHFVHGDLSGNVFLDDKGPPVVLDVSPYLRDRRWAAAVVVVDAVLWHGADPSWACRYASDGDGRDLLVRAAVFRLVAEQLVANPRADGALDRYRQILAVLR